MGIFYMMLIIVFASVRLSTQYPVSYNQGHRDVTRGNRVAAAPTAFRRPYPRPQQMKRPMHRTVTRPPHYGNPTLPSTKNELKPSRAVYDLRSLITTTSSNNLRSDFQQLADKDTYGQLPLSSTTTLLKTDSELIPLNTSKHKQKMSEQGVSDQDSVSKISLAGLNDSVMKLGEVNSCKFVIYYIAAF